MESFDLIERIDLIERMDLVMMGYYALEDKEQFSSSFRCH
jgi:hypothetical protein